MAKRNSNPVTASAWDAKHPEIRSVEARRAEKAAYYAANAEKIKAQGKAYRASLPQTAHASNRSVPKSDELTADRLRCLLSYDKETGVFVNLVKRGKGAEAGSKAGYLSPNGYVFISVDGTLYRAHRLAWLHVFGVWPANEIDHINRDKADNRLANLRDVIKFDNASNMALDGSSNVTGMKGVSFRAGRYEAKIIRLKMVYRLGLFKTAEAAGAAYLAACKEIGIGPMPEHAKTI